MNVVELQVEDFMRVKAVAIRPSGPLVEVSGDNDSGKSSTLLALITALGGAKLTPEDPVRHGAEVARIRLDLGELVVLWDCKAGGKPRLRVTSPDGTMEMRRPQEVLDGLFSRLTIDPLQFFSMKPAEQYAALADMMGLTEVMDREKAKRKALYEERTALGRDQKRVQALADSIPFEDVQPEDTQALMAELEVIEAHNKACVDESVRIVRASAEIETREERARENRAKAAKLIADADALDAEAVTLRAALEQQEAARMDKIDDAEIRARIKNAGEVNVRAKQQDDRRKYAAEAKALSEKAATLTEQIDAIDASIAQQVAAASVPVEGLSFGEGVLLYNGVLLDQASTAQQIRVSCAIARAQNPKLNIVLIRHGSLIGQRIRDLIMTDPGMDGYQVWIETVDTSGEKGFYLEDGEVVSVNGVPVAAEESDDE